MQRGGASTERPERTAPIPVTVIGGYLGAGKTTLINTLLAGDHGRRLAVLVNDFGAINIDAGLIADHDGETVALTNGCVCCSIAGDLGVALKQMAARTPRAEHIVIEASGVADPARTANYARGWPEFRPAGTIVLADAEAVRARADDKFIGETVRRQLRAGDLIVLGKTDLVPAICLTAVEAWLADTVPGCRIVPAVRGRLPWSLLLGPAEAERPDRALPSQPLAADDADHETLYSTFVWRPAAPVDRQQLIHVLRDAGPALLRGKGRLRLADTPSRQTIVQAVGQRIELETAPDDDAGRMGSDCLILILRRDAAALAALRQHLDALTK